MLKIDMHTHIMPKNIPNFAEKFGYGGFITLDHFKAGSAKMMMGDRFFREIQSNCWDVNERIIEYQKFETNVQVVCTIPVLFAYHAKPKDGLQVAQFLNDDLANEIAKNPKHYIGLGTLPMQDPQLAIQELHRLKNELNMPGVQIGSNINNVNLSDSSLFPVFEACQELGMAVFVHPWEMMGQQNMSKYWLPWLVGMPAETARAIASLIFGGVFERLPNLRVNFAHAGGSFLPTIGRLEHGFNCRPDLVAVDNPINPRNYLKKFWVDCITHDTQLLQYIIDLIGTERITLGSDYPFPLGDLEIGAFLETMNLSQSQLEDIYHKSTLEWLGLSAEQFM